MAREEARSEQAFAELGTGSPLTGQSVQQDAGEATEEARDDEHGGENGRALGDLAVRADGGENPDTGGHAETAKYGGSDAEEE